jgi:hypothetical protein
VNVVVDEGPTVVDWVLGVSVSPQTFQANAGVAAAPKATSVASNPRISADFLLRRLMYDANIIFYIYSLRSAIPCA